MVATTHDFFMHQLKDVYSAEKQILKALPRMIEKAQAEDLRSNLQAHLEETENQAVRLQSIFEQQGKKAQAHACLAMQGILAEGEENLASAEPEALDLVITASAARVEHYEMSAYRSLAETATALKEDKALKLIQESLAEEEAAAKKVEAALKKTLKAAD